jgi:hypothetical protein
MGYRQEYALHAYGSNLLTQFSLTSWFLFGWIWGLIGWYVFWATPSVKLQCCFCFFCWYPRPDGAPCPPLVSVRLCFPRRVIGQTVRRNVVDAKLCSSFCFRESPLGFENLWWKWLDLGCRTNYECFQWRNGIIEQDVGRKANTTLDQQRKVWLRKNALGKCPDSLAITVFLWGISMDFHMFLGKYSSRPHCEPWNGH